MAAKHPESDAGVRKPNRVRRYLLVALGALAIAFVAIVSLLPQAIRMGAESWLQERGVQHATIENIDLNLFTGSFAMEGLVADDGLSLGRLVLNIDWLPLRNRRVVVRSFELSDAEIEMRQEKGKWQLSTLALEAGTAAERSAGEPWQVELNAFEFNDVQLKAAGQLEGKPFELLLPVLSLKGSLTQADAGKQQLKSALKLGRVAFNGSGYAYEHGSLQLKGEVVLPPFGDANFTSGMEISDLDLKLNELSLIDLGKEITLAAVDSIVLDDLVTVGAKRAAFDKLSFRGLKLPAAGDDGLGRVNRLDLHQAELDFAGIYKLRKLEVEGLQAVLKKLQSGKMAVISHLQEVQEVQKGRQAEMAESSGAKVVAGKAPTQIEPLIRIGTFLISGDSAVAFRDESVSPPFETMINIETFKFAPVDLSGQAGVLDVALLLDKNGSFRLSGQLAPHSSNPRSDLTFTLQQFGMPKLSGYLESEFGQSIKTGQFDLSGELKIAERKIDATNKITIRKLALEKSKQTGRAEQSLGMPVDTALGMLRDKRGDITMDVPISGSLDDPNINVNDAINKALVSSIKSSALTYAKLVLQPYGSIILAAELASTLAKEAAKPKLTAVQFNERSANLSPEMTDYAVKIAELMKSKAFRIEICGIATRIEGGGATPEQPKVMDDEQLLALAKNRSDGVLKAIRDQGVDASRLFSCNPGIDEAAKKALPRVEITLD